MLFDAPETQTRLAQVIDSVTTDPNLRDDLVQEALLHFWQKESETPGQTLSFYLQSCLHRMRDYLERGRSLDSRKRRHLRTELPDEDTTEEALPPQLALDDVAVSSAIASDALEGIEARLSMRDRQILLLACDGAGVSEIARELHVSHVAIVKRLRSIRLAAVRLGIVSRIDFNGATTSP